MDVLATRSSILTLASEVRSLAVVAIPTRLPVTVPVKSPINPDCASISPVRFKLSGMFALLS